MESLQHYEERLTALEEVLLAQQAEDFDKKIFRIRRELSVLAGYYAQLTTSMPCWPMPSRTQRSTSSGCWSISPARPSGC